MQHVQMDEGCTFFKPLAFWIPLLPFATGFRRVPFFTFRLTQITPNHGHMFHLYEKPMILVLASQWEMI